MTNHQSKLRMFAKMLQFISSYPLNWKRDHLRRTCSMGGLSENRGVPPIRWLIDLFPSIQIATKRNIHEYTQFSDATKYHM